MPLLERITIEPGKCGGRPCIRGTRFRVVDMMELLAAGASHEEILADYPFLESADIQAALLYVAKLADHILLSYLACSGVRFLVDNQLPTALARWLAARGADTVHVLDTGLGRF